MTVALPKLQKRINDLESFDVNGIHQRFDPSVEALYKKVNSTLQDILGYESIEYLEYSLTDFDSLGQKWGGEHTVSAIRENYRLWINRAKINLNTLISLLEERIGEFGILQDAAIMQKTTEPLNNTSRVFVVHGHDDGTKEMVARFLRTLLGIEPIILHEQPNQGLTIIEKFESHAKNTDFAVILFTPDDKGYLANNSDEVKFRARQNVILELGFFMGKLGRQRVCVLNKGNVEVPSDLSGILYHLIDDAGAWKLSLAQDMQSCGLSVDLNNINNVTTKHLFV